MCRWESSPRWHDAVAMGNRCRTFEAKYLWTFLSFKMRPLCHIVRVMPQKLQSDGLLNNVRWHAHEWLCTYWWHINNYALERRLPGLLALKMKLLPSCETSVVVIYYSTRWILNGPAVRNSHLACTSLSVTTRRTFSPLSPFNKNISYAKMLFREQPMWKHKPKISWNSLSVFSCIFDKWMSCHIYLQIIQGACHTKMLVTPVLWNIITFTLLLPFWRITEFIAITVVGVECELIPAEPVAVNPW
jgi:hypothetical protein